MNIRVVAIQLPPEPEREAASFEVLAELDVNGEIETYRFTVSSLGMPGSDASIIEAELPFVRRFRGQRTAARHIEQLVGQAVQRGGVHLPQVIAA